MPGVSGAFETEDSGPRKRGSVKRTSSHDSDGTDEGVNGFEDDERFPFKTSLIGKFWVTSVVMQLALYVTCYVGATMEVCPLPFCSRPLPWRRVNAQAPRCWQLDEVLPDQEEVLPDGSAAGSPAAEIETSATGAHASNFETFVYIGIFWILLFQVKEIAPHVRAAGENELAYLKSESLQEKMTAMKRLKWHQRMCFIPQPLMALDALVGSMGMGGLLFRYASRSGCAKGIVDGLGQLDAKGWIMILVMLISVTVIITLLFICTRIHFAHFQAVNNTEAAQEYLQDKLASQGLTPRSGGAKSSRGLLWWYLLSVALQMLLVAMLSFAKESVAAKDDAESVGMAKGLFVLMAIGVFYLGHQVGQASGYITSVPPFLCTTLSSSQNLHLFCAQGERRTEHGRPVRRDQTDRMAQPQHVLPGFRRDPAGKHWDPKRASTVFLRKMLTGVRATCRAS